MSTTDMSTTDIGTTGGTRIRELIVTPIAFRDPPLLNSNGVHEPLALRVILQLVLEDGTVGLGESPGGTARLERLEAAAKVVVGMDVFDTTALAAAIDAALVPTVPSSHERGWTMSAVEVACLDAQGKLLGRPVSDLLGGRVRDSVPFAAYLFYKWAEHPALDGRVAVGDDWGAALDPAGIVEQARLMQQRYGFRSFKLKGGVFPPDEEIAAIKALAEAFPGQPLRLDPNIAWTVETSRYVAREMDGVLEYLEDPTATIAGMAQVAKESPLPLATNMCVIAWEHLKPAIEQDAIQVLLTDHHYWGGLRRTRELAAVCEAFGLALSMHSNSHLGISLAAMTHVAAAIPNLDHSCDTHYPWNSADDVVLPGVLEFRDGEVAVPTGPGLGVDLDHDALDRLHRLYLDSGMRSRDDTGYMQRIHPEYELRLPRW
ncbi:glucarate dehydratase family protein [Streptomyces sp. NBC_00201]|uniref:glucarate dehydratase family protein n=1 Tax=unclassified Streptomyces TaxID=2593676 RepID=UPI002252063A|nr:MULTISPECIES: glucarate dehydratase family protein [unclassified Streptomyces]MCX5059313.1 glucarate dehydratase family protein [Streptomyces sp. NBC_00452]MCX5244040.1 glucarate dehydratase family protein [Streptomyces sp. NBC_00201]MCX5290226.1 glucarate dehydratase family protein [Streptomyces sp. NBC_00183]